MNSVKSELWEVTNRLEGLGLKAGYLKDAVRRGYLATTACSSNHPPLMRGIVGWGEIVCALREYLVPLGWRPSDENNYSLVIDDKKHIAIAVATGDEGTGNPAGWPSTKSLKGPQTAAAISLNQNQLTLDLFISPTEEQAANESQIEPENRVTWMLLVYRAENEIRCEFSLPDQITFEGRINGWSERILLGAIPLDGNPLEISPPNQPDLDIQVTRRTS